tara:strand:+ start:10 stop:282 length:273 start_codon:yes stop_codon:yes gene_type:complete
VEIKTKKHFNEIIKSLTEEILDEEDLDEITTTAGAPGYMTPFAFKGKKKKKKKVYEALEDKDIVVIKKLIRVVVSDIVRDIWLKRNMWNK